MEIIPAIDLLNGQVVRLHKGDYQNPTVYSDNPLDVAKSFKVMGFKRVHVVDLDAAANNGKQNLNHLDSIASTGLLVDYSGGIRSLPKLATALDMGASWVMIGSVSIQSPELFMEMLTLWKENIILAADVNWVTKNVVYNGWLKSANLSVYDHIGQFIDAGLKSVMSTDTNVDGTLAGPNIELYSELISRFPTLDVIASGGVSGDEDLVGLRELGVSGVIVGKAIYENRISKCL